MVERALTPRGPYSLRLTTGAVSWSARLPERGRAQAVQLGDGRVLLRASGERAFDDARFLLALDDDTSEFHRRFAADPLIGRALRVLRGLRPRRRATVAHAFLRAMCGQLVQATRALEIERAVVRACGDDPPTREALARMSAARLVSCGLAESRAATLARVVRTLDLERLRERPEGALARLRRERGVGAWTVGVTALQGLGRYDAGLVGDLGLVKLLAALRGRWPEPEETVDLLAPYEEWKGLASVFLLEGFARGLVPGASSDGARQARAVARR